MTISNNSTITNTDLLAMNATHLANLATADLYPSVQANFNLEFRNITSLSSARNCQAIVYPPDDYLLNEVVITTTGVSGTITVSITDGFMIETLSMSATNGSGQVSFPRYYFANNALTLKPLQLIKYNSKLTITVSNSAISTPNIIYLTLCFDNKLRRT